MNRLINTFHIPLVVVICLAMGLAGCADSRSARVSSLEGGSSPSFTFTEVTVEAGLGAFTHEKGGSNHKWMPETVGGGCAFIDYNGDGWLDILLVGGAYWDKPPAENVPALWLYRNNGDGTFSLATEEAGLGAITAYGFGLSVADYDNDGDQDFFLSTLHENMLFRNDGGVFTEVGQKAGIANEDVWSTSAVFFDADRDGWLDLFVASYVDWSPAEDIYCQIRGKKAYCTPEAYEGVASRYYHNNGDGTFTERTKEAGLIIQDPTLDKALGVAALDYNEDGWPDLVVANDTERTLLYENDGDGTFTEKSRRLGIAFNAHGTPRAGMGIDAGVVDSTGQVTVFTGNFSEEMVGVYRYLESGIFMDRAAVSQIGHASLNTLTFGLFLFDVEYDGDLDLFLANGHVQPRIELVQEYISYEQPPQLFLNRGDGTFKEVKRSLGGLLEQPMVARGAAFGDYDRDGDLDVLVTENDGPAHLWRNDLKPAPVKAGGANFLRVEVEGRESNRDGIGTRIIAVNDGYRMYRRIHTGSSFLSQSEKVASFGLGDARQVDSLIVQWPSGQKEVFTDVDANQQIKIVEGSGQYTTMLTYGGAALAQGS